MAYTSKTDTAAKLRERIAAERRSAAAKKAAATRKANAAAKAPAVLRPAREVPCWDKPSTRRAAVH